MKKCRRCGETKPISEFGRYAQSRDGRNSYCVGCWREVQAEYRRRRAERDGRVVRQARARLPGKKWCPDCQAYKPVEDFGQNRSTSDGLTGYCKPCHARRGAMSKQRVHGGSRHYHLVRRYGISAERAAEMLQRQAGRCAICRRDLGDRPHVDHDYVTGRVRALLCFNCNGGLGQFADDRDRLERAIIYLKCHTVGKEFEGRFALFLKDAGASDGPVMRFHRQRRYVLQHPSSMRAAAETASRPVSRVEE